MTQFIKAGCHDNLTFTPFTPNGGDGNADTRGKGKGYVTHQQLVRCIQGWSDECGSTWVKLGKDGMLKLLLSADIDRNGRIYYNE
jgi:hypothetical protein